MALTIEQLDQRVRRGVGFGVFLVAFAIYFATMAPTTSFWDCGEFIACSKILGVMHPPGAPLYLLIGRIMTMLPIAQDIGARVNVFSVLVSAATSFLTFLIIAQLIRRWRGQPQNGEDIFLLYFGAALGALAFTFTDSQWFNAVEAEVYAFSMFFTAAVIWLMLHWEEAHERPESLLWILLIFYLFGLAVGVHLLNLLTFPTLFLIAYFHHNETVRRLFLLLAVQAAVPIGLYVLLFQFNPEQMTYEQILSHQAKAMAFLKWFGLLWLLVTLIYIYFKDRYVFKIWWIIPGLVLIAYSTYLVIFIRAKLQPPINENDPSTWKAMADYLARKQYGEEDLLLTFLYRKADFWRYQIQMMYIRYFGWQFIGHGTTFDNQDRIVEIISFKGLYGLPFLVGLWGAVHHFFRDWKRAVAILVLFFMTGLAIILYVNQSDPQPRERDYSYCGSFFAFSLWIGIGAVGLLEWIGDALRNRGKLRRWAFAGFALLMLVAVPVNLVAHNYHSHDRSGNYVAYDYSLNKLESCEPYAVLFTNGDNDTFPLWFLQEVYGIRKDVRIVNLSLLNTSWYIKQLRDQEPKVPIGLSDRAIEALQPIPWKAERRYIPVPPEVVDSLKRVLPPAEAAKVQDRITFTLKPTIRATGGTGLRVQDLMVLRILEQARWKRPVYFAVTVAEENMLGLQEYFRMDGLAFKVMPYPPSENDPDILYRNLIEKFQYRNLDNPKVYYDRNILKLLQNYRSAFIQLSSLYYLRGQTEKALEVLDHMERRIPMAVIPFSDERAALAVADLYQRLGRPVDLDLFMRHLLPGRQIRREDQLRLAYYYAAFFGETERAEKVLLDLLAENPSDGEVISELYRLYKDSKQYRKAAEILEKWLKEVNPNDPTAKSELEAMRRLAGDSLAKE